MKKSTYKQQELVLTNPCLMCEGRGWSQGIFRREVCIWCKGTGARGGTPSYKWQDTGVTVEVEE